MKRNLDFKVKKMSHGVASISKQQIIKSDHTAISPKILDEWYKAVIQSTTEGFILRDLNGNILDVNDATCSSLGYSRQELLNMKIQDISALTIGKAEEEALKFLHEFQERDLIPYGSCSFEIRHVCKDGRIMDVFVSNGYLDVLGGLIFCFHKDITEQKRMHQQLKESEERYRSLIDLGGNIGEAVVMLQDTNGKEGTQIFVSDKWCDITGYSRKELQGMSFFDLLQPRYRRDSIERHRRKMKGDSIPDHFEMSIIRRDDTELPIEVTSAATTYQGNVVNVAYIRDITERKKMEKQLRLFSRRIISAQEAERMRIARELHDQMAQDLVAIRIEVESLAEQYRGSNIDSGLNTSRLLNLIDSAIDNVQSISSRLRPQMLDTFGLVKAIQCYAEDFEHHCGISCQTNVKSGHLIEETIDKELSILAYRIVQEALMNVFRHSKATKVIIDISVVKDILKISVTDNGCGMKVGTPEEISSLGILGMRERASLAGGTLSIRSRQGKGTTVAMSLPLSGSAVTASMGGNEYY